MMDPPDLAAILDLCTPGVKSGRGRAGEFIRGDGGFLDDAHVRARDRLHPVLLPLGSPAVGRALGELALPGDVERAEASILG